MKRMIMGLLLSFAMLFGMAGTSVAQTTQVEPRPVAQTVTDDKPSWAEPSIFYSRNIRNSPLSNRNVKAAVGPRGTGEIMVIAPGSNSTKKAKSVLVPAGCMMHVNGLPMNGGLFGLWVDVRTFIPLGRMTVILYCPW